MRTLSTPLATPLATSLPALVSALLILPAFLIGFTVNIGTASACSCMESPVTEVYEESDAVFLGTVTKIETTDLEEKVTFSVEQSWKGVESGTVTITTEKDSATCGIDYLVGEQTPVFAEADSKGGLRAVLCDNIFTENPMTYLENISDGETDDCQPHVCTNGATHPSCTDDGHPINYVQDPCNSGSNGNFSDVSSSHSQAQAIAYVRAEGIVSGYPDGTFKPSNPVNRAEFSKMIALTLYTDNRMQMCLDANSSRFPDVTRSAWFAGFVCPFVEDGIIKGYPNGTFGPEKNINAAEAAKIIVGAYHLQTNSTGAAGAWWQVYIDALRSRGALYASYRKPEQLLTRGDLAEILWKLKVPGL